MAKEHKKRCSSCVIRVKNFSPRKFCSMVQKGDLTLYGIISKCPFPTTVWPRASQRPEPSFGIWTDDLLLAASPPLYLVLSWVQLELLVPCKLSPAGAESSICKRAILRVGKGVRRPVRVIVHPCIPLHVHLSTPVTLDPPNLYHPSLPYSSPSSVPPTFQEPPFICSYILCHLCLPSPPLSLLPDATCQSIPCVLHPKPSSPTVLNFQASSAPP